MTFRTLVTEYNAIGQTTSEYEAFSDIEEWRDEIRKEGDRKWLLFSELIPTGTTKGILYVNYPSVRAQRSTIMVTRNEETITYAALLGGSVHFRFARGTIPLREDNDYKLVANNVITEAESDSIIGLINEHLIHMEPLP